MLGLPMQKIRTLLGKPARTGPAARRPLPPYVRPAIRRGLVYFPDLNLVYVQNAKSGSSTLMKTLWIATDRKRGETTFAGSARDSERSPGLSIKNGTLHTDTPEAILEAVHFTVVRHPLVRLVSGYIDKIRGRKLHTWDGFCHRYGVAEDAAVSFPDFLDLIAADDPQGVDKHFRAQTFNIALGYVPYAHIGHLEDMAATGRFLEANGVAGIRSARPHATGAAERLQQYLGDPALLKKAIDYLEADFKAFNYAPGLESTLPLAPIEPQRVDTGPLRAILIRDAGVRAPTQAATGV